MNKISHEQIIRDRIHSPVRSITPLHGGSIASSYRVECGGSETLFAKTAPQFPDMFEKEANGLHELSKAGSIRVPEVIMADDQLLLLEFLPAAPVADRTLFFERLGRSMAALHRKTGKRFGFTENNYIGSTPQINLPNHDAWKDFFVANRLEFQIRLSEQNGYRDKEITAKFYAVERTIDVLIPNDGEPPALLHGDLWSGNVLVLEGDRPAVIDPAVYYGHREADLAMTLLFGGFEERFLSAYHEAFPLHEEWERRMELYKLYHLLNHLNLFGEGYLPQIYSTLQRLLR